MDNWLILTLFWLAILFIVVFIVSAFTLPIYILRRQQMKSKIANKGKCVRCGMHAFELRQTMARGLLIWSFIQVIDTHFCEKHGKQLYERTKSYNLKNSWWSLRGVARTPFLLQENQFEYTQFKKAFR